MPAIRTRELTKRYGDVVAVDGLDLTVREGEVFGFLGPNGAGKSTVIDLLLDFARPTEGSATVLGHDPRAEADRVRRRTGVLPEGAAPYDRLTGREHVAWIADANGVDADVEGVLDRVGLDPADAARPAGEYSTGMTRRLGLAMALVGDPDLLILDEPSAGLDPAGIRELRRIVREEADRGTTVFFSSHHLDQVEAVCDRIGILHEGRLAATGTPNDLRSRLDLGGTIAVEVERVPSGLALGRIDGVESVAVEGTTIRANLRDSRAKVEVVTHLAERTAVLDLVADPGSLERLFDAYTGSTASRGDPTTGGAPENAPAEVEP